MFHASLILMCLLYLACQEVKKCILRGGFHIIKTRKLHLTAEDAGKFYAEHQGRCYDWLSCILHIVATTNMLLHSATSMYSTVAAIYKITLISVR